ncbi:hypothetical protein E0L21_10700 [Kosakonia quasisacchari]|uniref:Uncharacterized protein n=1 Tax=Kosakonia quasisacchari TaxID=2529380 RepID=A0A4R0HHP9_9ENTR|nr:nucleotidyltransferase family protein [Kosakonia quasisacchari]TCC09274.1 hypothetical protein E0L21_10700 [Kosakonia quasisacchari]
MQYLKVLSSLVTMKNHLQQDYSSELLYQIVNEHRIVGYILFHGDNFPLATIKESDLSWLRTAYDEVQHNFYHIIGALQSLSQSMASENVVMFLLKGFSLYLANPKEERLRWCHDVDLISTNSEKLKNKLITLSSAHTHDVSPHELLTAIAFDIEIDLHRHYPVWSTTPDAGVTKNDDKLLRMHHHGKLEVCRLIVDDLLFYEQKIAYVNNLSIRLPDAAAAAIIHCAHCYRNAISRSSVSIRHSPAVKVVELLEIREYLTDDNFNLQRFTQLVWKLKAVESIKFVARVMHSFLADSSLLNIIEKIAPAANNNLSRLICIWGGFWQYISWQHSYYLYRHIKTEMLIEPLRGENFSVKRNDDFFIEIDSDDVRPLCQHHVFMSDGNILPIKFNIVFQDCEVHISITAGILTQYVNKRMYVDIFEQSFEHNWNILENKTKWKCSDKNSVQEVVFCTLDDGYRLDLRFSYARASGDVVYPIIIAAGEFEEEHIMHAGTLIPFNLIIK